jgi:hypothetical protein
MPSLLAEGEYSLLDVSNSSLNSILPRCHLMRVAVACHYFSIQQPLQMVATISVCL